jgi:predicted membrane protein
MTVKKSLYIFLCAIMGAMLFLILQQILAFGYLFLLYANYQTFSFGLSFINLMAFDYFTLILVVMLGAWYGIWLGLYWFDLVYESGRHGFVEHVMERYWPSRRLPYNLKSKISAVEKKLEGDLMELESLGQKSEKKLVKRRVARRKTE